MKNDGPEFGGRFGADPESVVREAWQRAHAMGANDGESSVFEDILARLREGQCSVEDAVREAEHTVDRKESYH